MSMTVSLRQIRHAQTPASRLVQTTSCPSVRVGGFYWKQEDYMLEVQQRQQQAQQAPAFTYTIWRPPIVSEIPATLGTKICLYPDEVELRFSNMRSLWISLCFSFLSSTQTNRSAEMRTTRR